MSSIIPGYQYDIFISYRHNDNRSGWVTGFVKALEEELAATLKEPVSVYFDSNPHDGLLETHNVDKSLEGKLKCLIFIPVLSQTYCDTKSFAWQKEFCAFHQLAKEDPYGLFVNLPNGNVATRILPVQIHELDQGDKQLLEGETGEILRAIEFIFASPGVNRPLAPDDKREENDNKTYYRDQINKVANAVKAIITGMTSPKERPETKSPSPMSRKTPTGKVWPFVIMMTIALILLSGYFLFDKYATPPEDNAPIDRSIAVLPFVNMSNDPDQEYFSDGLSEELLNLLAKISDLKVIARTSSFSFKNTNEDIRVIGEKLEVGHILEGSVRKSGERIRVTAQLINVETGAHLWSESYDTETTDIFEIQDQIAGAIVGELKLLLTGSTHQALESRATNLTTYELYLKARQKLAARGNNLLEARALFEQVIDQDKQYSMAYSGLARTLSLIPEHLFPPREEVIALTDLAFPAAREALALQPDNAEALSVLGHLHASHNWQWKEGEKYLVKSVELEPNNAEMVNFLGDYYRITGHPKAVEIEQRALQLDPLHPVKHVDLAIAWLFNGEIDRAIEIASNAVKLDSSSLMGIHVLAHLLILDKKYGQVERLAQKMDLLQKGQNQGHSSLDIQARYYFALGKREEVLEIIKKMKLYSETNGQFFIQLAELYTLMNSWEEAGQYYEKAYEARSIGLRNVLLWTPFADMPRVEKMLDFPEFNALFEIRRENKGL